MKLEDQRSSEPLLYTKSQHGISRSAIDDDARAIIARLQRHGFDAYVVGGGVRDILLQKQPKDFDIATAAKPNDIKKLFRNSRIIGRRFRLAHIFFGQRKVIEVATFRDSGEPDESDEHASDDQNIYGTERTDAFRRDLTINALFYDPMKETIIDYVGGMNDLHHGVIRVIGEPSVRFHEDPVRMLRVVRHAARSGFRIESGCLTAIQEQRELLRTASPARLYEEFKKDVSSGSFAPVVRLLHSSGLLDVLLPDLLAHDDTPSPLPVRHPLIKSLSILDELINTEEPVGLTPAFSFLLLFRLSLHLDTSELIRELKTKEQVVSEMGGAFGELQVPRRERDRVAELFSILRRLLENPGLIQRFKHREVFGDLRYLLIALNDIEAYRSLLTKMEGEHLPITPRRSHKRQEGPHRGRHSTRRQR